jgi:hypothetical protein
MLRSLCAVSNVSIRSCNFYGSEAEGGADATRS